MTYNVLMGTLNPTHSLTRSGLAFDRIVSTKAESIDITGHGIHAIRDRLIRQLSALLL